MHSAIVFLRVVIYRYCAQKNRSEEAMIARFIRILIFLLISLAPLSLFAQMPVGGAGIPSGWDADMPLRSVEKQIWHIFGKVRDLRGEPLRAASVRVDLGSGTLYVKRLTTDAQGNFRTEYTLDGKQFKQLSVNLNVEREGYLSAHEFVNFGESGKTWEIDVAMRESTASSEDLGQESLVKELGPKLRASLEGGITRASERKELARGTEELFDRQNPVKATENLDQMVKKYPDCADCRMLLGLARLEAGGLNGAAREFSEVVKEADAKGNNLERARLNLIFGVLEDWKGEYNKAAGFLMQAKAQAPGDPLILRELGRTLIFQNNWEAADEYLGQALRAGATKDTMLLRVHALLEEGDARAAEAQLKDYMGDRPLKDFPLPVHSLYTQIQARRKLESSARVASVLSQPPDALAHAMPELRGIQPAANQDELPMILAKTGEDVRSFFQNMSNTMSEEQVRETRLGKKGETKDLLEEKFQYLLLTTPQKWGVDLEEYRTDKNGDRTAPKGLSEGLMLTSGFVSASLMFHPAYQAGATFRLLGRQDVGGHHCHVVAFAQKPEKPKMIEGFNTDQETVMVLLQGVAWIDQDTYKLIRLRSDLLTPQPRIRLERQTTQITYEPVQFKQLAMAMWLPSAVDVTVLWRGRTFRNSHTYSRFKLFNTEVKEKIQKLEPAAPTPPLETPAGPGNRR
jgi:tetratricopeptide (TPR) repeat protein